MVVTSNDAANLLQEEFAAQEVVMENKIPIIYLVDSPVFIYL